jgi:CHAT domain-containing protein
LGDGSPFTLDEMKNEKDLFSGVELLTLSACNTAAQQPDANGREVDGFAELAQRLGANSVLATLWPVADNSTPWMMREFYDLKINKHLNKAEALRHAQLSLLKGEASLVPAAVRADQPQLKIEVTDTPPASRGAEIIYIPRKDAPLFKNDPKRPFAHPYYWAPFVLFGNWR